MRNGLKGKLQKTVIISTVLMFLVPTAWAGNRAMVEQRTQELDEINKQAVGQIPDLPRDGTVELKANARYKEGNIQFDVYDKKISDAKEESISLDDDQGANAGSVKQGSVYTNNVKDISDGEKPENDPKGD